jgi:hypothetical protein
MVKALPIELKDLYVGKKVHHDTFTQILGDKNPLVLFRMYYTVNDVVERQELFECTDDKYFVLSSISTKIALTKDAKEQAKVARLKGLHKSPYYKIRVIITEKRSNTQVFDFEHKTTRKSQVYDTIPILEKRINKLLWKIED